jgi:hypothetical protein
VKQFARYWMPAQRRSDFGWADVIQYLKEGHLGKIRWIHGLNFKLRDP